MGGIYPQADLLHGLAATINHHTVLLVQGLLHKAGLNFSGAWCLLSLFLECVLVEVVGWCFDMV